MDAETDSKQKHQSQLREIRPVDHNNHIRHGLVNKILEISGGHLTPYHQCASPLTTNVPPPLLQWECF